jgi:hypothetical protein
MPEVTRRFMQISTEHSMELLHRVQALTERMLQEVVEGAESP